MQGIIRISNLKKTYKGNPDEILKGVDLEILPGEFFGLLGPNAAGKTTLISIICGLLKFDEGSVIVNDIDIAVHYRKINQFIGLIPQEIALYPTLTVRENLAFFGEMHGLSGKMLKNKIEEYIEVVQLEHHAGKRIATCSGGIKRRANLAAGLIHDPAIVFLDEPTLGVDAQSMNLIYDYLQRLNGTGKTIIYTTHYMKEAENLCNRVTIIDDGRVISKGTPAELIQNNAGCSDLGQVFIKLTGRELRD
ncbi:MAG TPA: ABC transporter ATP-binding protein [Bacteroidales bacterium]|nr:ABC transporter ATP-binding protein [Bacteroidales bacterium]HQI69422.1 ABC transporter ATP-binding protein [Bacteroidales bacterium]